MSCLIFFQVTFTSSPLWIWYRMSDSEKRVSSHNWKRSSVLLGLVISYCWWLLFIMAQELSRKCFTNDPHLSTVCLINWFGVTPSTIGKTTLTIAMTTLLANILWWLHTGLKKILQKKKLVFLYLETCSCKDFYSIFSTPQSACCKKLCFWNQQSQM